MTTEKIWDHAVEFEWDDEREQLYANVVHPPTCFCIRHYHPKAGHIKTERPHCVIDYQQNNVGLTALWRDEDWDSLAYDLYPGGRQALYWRIFDAVETGEIVPIYAEATYGWSNTPDGREYEFEFWWLPRDRLNTELP